MNDLSIFFLSRQILALYCPPQIVRGFFVEREMSVIIGLCNPKSPTNVGGVMRAAGCYQACAVRYSGERYDRAVKFQTDTKNIQSKIPLTAMVEITQDLPSEIKIVCVELAEGATPLPEFIHPEKALYVFGPEDGSIPQEIVNQASEVVYIPTIGCMNLAASVNVLLYDRLAKSKLDIDHSQRILSSRDVKNRLKFKRADQPAT
ncbi:TrmH family RNA methyltransferase [Vibrio anguillarum]|uniref:TrmH family RNA methyltransferase n=1 Tax=Vibrio anguillarum TaxID=55601 RepID=A0AAW4AKX5_VIBAN|nr:RRNA methylase, SpoU family [Vibrio anguillarum 775]AGU59380.1 23S rRNA methyltransferase [Vibrio anguillarum M3]ASF94226.1 23S rRNA methyltransferase [Vibrio anguillarum]ATA50944.1 23S rRNA methyltransferase [Vibrio anguillarum]AVT66260.1 23S rRNA methyltransferase [Vibrio anguillarum]